jgi:hypothetical protein
MIDSGLGRVDGRDAYTKVTIAKPAWVATRLVRRGRSTDEVELARARWKRQHGRGRRGRQTTIVRLIGRRHEQWSAHEDVRLGRQGSTKGDGCEVEELQKGGMIAGKAVFSSVAM